MRCSNCNHENREGIKFCEECGTELPKLTQQTCPECGHANRKGIKFCEECGAVLAAKKPKAKKSHFCPQCGHENRAGVNFCEECGASLTGAPAPAHAPTPAPRYVHPAAPVQTPAPAQPVYAAPQPKRRTWLWAVGGGLLVVLLCCFSYVLLPAPPVSGDTALPDFVDNAWEEVVAGREYYQNQGGLLGAVVTGVEAIIPNPVKDAVGDIVGGIVKAPVDKPPGQAPPDGEFPEECGGVITCRGRDRDLCELCGGEWKDFGDEEYCWCGGGGQYTDKRWCEELIRGRWVEEEDRCTLLPEEDEVVEEEPIDLRQASGCPDIIWEHGVDDRQEVQQICKDRGGVLNSFDKVDNQKVCMCPTGNAVKDTCDWLGDPDFKPRHRFVCDDKRDFCWLYVEPGNIIDQNSWRKIVIEMRDGTRVTTEKPGRGTGGCSGQDEIVCTIETDSAIDPNQVKDIFICADLCCLSLIDLENSGIFGLTDGGGCPDPNDISFEKFKNEGGWYSFDLINNLPWETDIFYGELSKANGDYWHRYECTIDPNNKYRMDCGSAPGESGIGTVAGTGSLTFDPDVFGASCNIELNIDADFGSGCPEGQTMCYGSCCSIGHCCDGECYQSCP